MFVSRASQPQPIFAQMSRASRPMTPEHFRRLLLVCYEDRSSGGPQAGQISASVQGLAAHQTSQGSREIGLPVENIRHAHFRRLIELSLAARHASVAC